MYVNYYEIQNEEKEGQGVERYLPILEGSSSNQKYHDHYLSIPL
jgi:hypothetical protein